MSAQLGIFTRANGVLLADDTAILRACSFSTGVHGCADLRASAPMVLDRAFAHYDWPSLPHALLRADGATPYAGRLEDVAISGDGLSMTALGYSRALSDSPYTALWSTSKVGAWRPITSREYVLANETLYNADQNNRLYVSLKKDAVYRFGNDLIGWEIVVPSGSSRDIAGVSFDIAWSLPSNWVISYGTALDEYLTGNVTLGTITATGGANQTTLHAAIGTPRPVLYVICYNGSGAPYTNTGLEDYARFMTLTNVRVVTDVSTRVSTTTTAVVTGGTNITIPVVSSAGMYVGQQIQFGSSAPGNGYTFVVTAVPDATHVTVASTGALASAASGAAVQAHRVLADTIVRDLLATVVALNPTQLSASGSLIASPGVDLLDEQYLDMLPSAILDRLIALGDTQSPPRPWAWGVWDDQQLFFWPEGTAAQSWYVDISDLDLQRTIDTLANRVYATYQDATGRTVRTLATTDTASVTRMDLTRTKQISASTTNAAQVAVQQAVALADAANPPPRFGITVGAVYTAAGARSPIWLPRAGDTVTVRNLPPTISVDIDRIRTFRIARTTCDLVTGTLHIEPAAPLPSLAALLARTAAGIK